jgi:hypothetical protein
MRSLADVAAGQYYRHYKGGFYFVIAVANDANDEGPPVVVYAAVGKGDRNWFLPADEFLKLLPGDLERFAHCTFRQMAMETAIDQKSLECPRCAEAKS